MKYEKSCLLIDDDHDDQLVFSTIISRLTKSIQCVFADNGLELKFLKSNLAAYKQFRGDFIPGLSIIDIMMFNSPEAISKMMEDYELI